MVSEGLTQHTGIRGMLFYNISFYIYTINSAISPHTRILVDAMSDILF